MMVLYELIIIIIIIIISIIIISEYLKRDTNFSKILLLSMSVLYLYYNKNLKLVKK